MSEDSAEKIQEVKSKMKIYPDFPKKGLMFLDIFSALSSGPTCQLIHSLLVKALRTHFPDVEALVALESRGFLFAFSLAAELGIKCVPVRKKGKLPGDVIAYKYQLEYGEDIVEIQKDAIAPRLRCVLIDDVIATGGTLAAAVHLLETCGAHVHGALVIAEIVALGGRKKIGNIPLHALIEY